MYKVLVVGGHDARLAGFGLETSILERYTVNFLTKLGIGIVAGMVAISGQAAEPLGFYGFDHDIYSPAGLEGMAEIYSGKVFLSGIPVTLTEAMGRAAAEGQAKSGQAPDLGYNPSTDVGQFYATGSMPSPPNRQAPPGMSIGRSVFERDGAKLVGGNCFACHTGVVNGQVVAGLGNNGIMPGGDGGYDSEGPKMSDFVDKLNNEAEKREFAIAMASGSVRAPRVPELTSRGDHYGPFAVWGLGAVLADPAKKGLAISDEETELVKLFKSTVVPPVDPMPWWLMKYKERDYWYSDGAPDDAAHFSFNFTTTHPLSNEYHTAHVESTAKALAFARETVSPPYPDALDADLVKLGEELFHGRTKPADTTTFKTCAGCHGEYSRKPDAKDYAMAGGWYVSYDNSDELKDVKTDTAYNDVLRTFRPIARHIDKLQTYYAAQGTPELAPTESYPDDVGYVAPPLVGVWATAPYFHNGSVPVIEAVLNSALRPEIWARSTDAFDYDLERVGLDYTVVTRDEFEASAEAAAKVHPMSKTAIDHEYIYDTTGYGRGNGGHTFGDSLSEHERSAIIEFLKSLSGRDM